MAKNKPEYYTEDEEVAFYLLDEDTMRRIIDRGDVQLPKKKVQVPKDMRWNTKIFNSELIDGMEDGDTMWEIANRIFPEIMLRVDLTGKTAEEIEGIIKKNKQSAMRNASTMVTEAECMGRLDSYKNLASQGVIQHKIWMSTPDDRTRPSHVDLDGEEREIDAPFSNGCQAPGDSNGPAEEVWQCRCTIHDKIIGFRRSDGSISYVNRGSEPKTLHDQQMSAEKAKREREANEKRERRQKRNG